MLGSEPYLARFKFKIFFPHLPLSLCPKKSTRKASTGPGSGMDSPLSLVDEPTLL